MEERREDLGHRIWGWIGREFGAQPDEERPDDVVPILEAAPTERVEALAAQLLADDIAAFVSKCGAMGGVVVPWPTDVLRSSLRLAGMSGGRANLYVYRAQLAEVQALVGVDVPDDQAP